MRRLCTAPEATRQSAWFVRCHLPLGDLPRSKGERRLLRQPGFLHAILEALALPRLCGIESIGDLSCQKKRRGRFVISKSAAARAARQGKSEFWRSVMPTRIPSNDESCLEMVRD